jgi:hypothetical protein
MKRKILSITTALTLMVMLWLAAVVLPGCSAQASTEVSTNTDAVESEEQATTTVVWSNSLDCASCHLAEAQSADEPMALYSLHVAHEEYNECTDCHVDSGGQLADAHGEEYAVVGADMPVKLSKTSVSEQTCLTPGCHIQEELITATASCMALTDSNGTVVNPHVQMFNEEHRTGSGKTFACSDCHKMHAASGLEAATTEKEAENQCLSCHHQDVYECYTCHT